MSVEMSKSALERLVELDKELLEKKLEIDRYVPSAQDRRQAKEDHGWVHRFYKNSYNRYQFEMSRAMQQLEKLPVAMDLAQHKRFCEVRKGIGNDIDRCHCMWNSNGCQCDVNKLHTPDDVGLSSEELEELGIEDDGRDIDNSDEDKLHHWHERLGKACSQLNKEELCPIGRLQPLLRLIEAKGLASHKGRFVNTDIPAQEFSDTKEKMKSSSTLLNEAVFEFTRRVHNVTNSFYQELVKSFLKLYRIEHIINWAQDELPAERPASRRLPARSTRTNKRYREVSSSDNESEEENEEPEQAQSDSGADVVPDEDERPRSKFKRLRKGSPV